MQHLYDQLIALPNLFAAWLQFKSGKEKKLDVQQFAYALEDNLFDLYLSLQEGRYEHGSYQAFQIRDPKLRNIHKATVRDRVLHHAVAKVLDRLFDRGFIHDSYSSRTGKGVHRAVRRLRRMAWRLSQNRTRTVWYLKCDVRKFFDSVDHVELLKLVRKRIKDEQFMRLVEDIVTSYATKPGKGIPLGNLTSQVFSNIYLNPFDQFMKRTLRIKEYVRYADDFVRL